MNQGGVGQHTRNEILSQPQTWKATLQRLQQLDGSVFPNTADYDQVVFCGCGSTYFLSRWAARLAESMSGRCCRAVPASDLLLFPDSWWHPSKRTLLVSISRSARTTETIRATERFVGAKSGDAVVITCYPDQPLARLTRHVIAVPDAQEGSVAQTRSFTSMMLGVIWLILRRIPPELPGLFADAGGRLIDNHQRLVEQIGRDDSLQSFFFLGSGALYGLANEAMLKMKEMSLSHSESFHFHEFRHGPMAVVNERSLVLGLISDSAEKQEHAVLREMRHLGARTLALQEHADPPVHDAPDHHVWFESGIPEMWRAPLYLPILQLLAFERSLHKLLDADRPAHLTSVVVLDEHVL
jgi:glucosamine--fructose-6-phosphate aminotransferase (isomerizing)